jgi:hypothetical protein
MIESQFLFDDLETPVQAEWKNMPEYIAEYEDEPEITATFKFRCLDDFEEFNLKMREHLYYDERVFDGMQTKTKKQAWYPLKEKSSRYIYKAEKIVNPKYPIYIVSKGRYEKNPTSKVLTEMKVDFFMIVEENEFNLYKELVDESRLLILPQQYKDDYDRFWIDDDKRCGPGAARNFAWQHSIDNGHKWHWVMDDNIESFERYNKNKKIKCIDGTLFKICEDFVDRYENVAIAGLNYSNFYPANEARPVFNLNTRIYSCLLIKNEINYRWRGRYNEDTDLSLRVLKDGLCTLQFNIFLQGKMSTQKIKGGNTAEFYDGEGTMPKSKMLVDMHPDVSKLVWRFNRWHHHVDYSQFKKNRLIKKENINIPDIVNNYGMKLIAFK